ncbi:MAG TPA: alpha/beta fold hydrolase [Pirellulales bacterium]|nr:alpha/beta fold hydrolase [Pirellulales bacterium]
MNSDGVRFTWLLRWALFVALVLPLDVRTARAETADEKAGAELKIPPPEEVFLKAKDGLSLHAIYYPGAPRKGKNQKDSVPVILLHAYNGDCHDFDDLAELLQKQGHAVVTPDLRGHGESKEMLRDGREEKLETSSLRTADFGDMWTYDLEAVKSFLIGKNNAGELNIDKLCVVGAEMGAIVGANWASLDWSWPVLSNGKQGQDVKALVMISPQSNFKGVKLIDAVSSPDVRSELAVMLIAGRKNSRSADEVNKLYKHFMKYHVEKTSPVVELLLPETKLQSTKLLGEKSLGVEAAILKFVDGLVAKPYPWAERRSALE